MAAEDQLSSIGCDPLLDYVLFWIISEDGWGVVEGSKGLSIGTFRARERRLSHLMLLEPSLELSEILHHLFGGCWRSIILDWIWSSFGLYSLLDHIRGQIRCRWRLERVEHRRLPSQRLHHRLRVFYRILAWYAFPHQNSLQRKTKINLFHNHLSANRTVQYWRNQRNLTLHPFRHLKVSVLVPFIELNLDGPAIAQSKYGRVYVSVRNKIGVVAVGEKLR